MEGVKYGGWNGPLVQGNKRFQTFLVVDTVDRMIGDALRELA
jgi:hypothetical protein